MPYADPEKRKECDARRRLKNRDKILARDRISSHKYYHSNKEKMKEYQRGSYAANTEARREWQRRYRQENLELARDNDKQRRLRSPRKFKSQKMFRDYGITLEQAESMVADQGCKCPICETTLSPVWEPGARSWHVDHCHSSGVVRGILCSLCNVGLGAFKDRQDSLSAAIRYLAKERLASK